MLPFIPNRGVIGWTTVQQLWVLQINLIKEIKMNEKFTITLEEDPETKDLIMPFPDGLCDRLGWEIGDTLHWNQSTNGSFILSKEQQQTQWVLVECVSTFRQRYMVEVPVGIDNQGKDKSLWALDTVTLEEATEFSSEHLGETIVSHRVVTKEEALTLCDQDNDYCISWDEQLKTKNFFTTWPQPTDSSSDQMSDALNPGF